MYQKSNNSLSSRFSQKYTAKIQRAWVFLNSLLRWSAALVSLLKHIWIIFGAYTRPEG